MNVKLEYLANRLSESEKVILFSAIGKKGVFGRKCEIKLADEECLILSDGGFLYPLGKVGSQKGFVETDPVGILGNADNVRKVLNADGIRKWTVMEKEFVKLEGPEKFEEGSLPKGIKIRMVGNAEQLRQYCHLKGQFIKEESGEVVDVDKMIESLGVSYPVISPVLMSYEDRPIGIVNSNFSSREGSMINMLYVEKEHRSHGYGKILLRWFINQLLKNTKNIYLFYSPDNIPAKRIYEKLGFRKIDKWLMAL
jgi:GNAT superfamily N-acetyltransferase